MGIEPATQDDSLNHSAADGTSSAQGAEEKMETMMVEHSHD